MWVDAVAALTLFVVAFGYANVGVGGAVLYFPVLSWCYPHWAPAQLVALTLLISVVTLAVSVSGHFFQGHIDRRTAVALMAPMAAGAWFGARATVHAPPMAVKIGFAALLMIVAWRMARGQEAAKQDATRRWTPLVTAAFGIALCSGAFGIGGGTLLVPTLMRFSGLATRAAIGTAASVLLPTALAGVVSYAAADASELMSGRVLLLLTAALAGSALGLRFGFARLRERGVKRLFIGALVVAAIVTVLREVYRSGAG